MVVGWRGILDICKGRLKTDWETLHVRLSDVKYFYMSEIDPCVKMLTAKIFISLCNSPSETIWPPSQAT